MSKMIQKSEQRQKLNPKQIIEANLMQLNYYSLEKRITKEIEDNPILEIEEENSEDLAIKQENEDGFNWDELVSNPEDYSTYTKKEIYESSTSAHKLSLYDDFVAQLNDLNISDNDLKIAKFILGNLDESGYLKMESILIADKFSVKEKNIKDIIDIIKFLDPPGVASKNMQESLIAQLEVLYPDEQKALKILKNNFIHLKNHNYNKIIEKTGYTLDEVSNILKLISILNSEPAINYMDDTIEHIIPDLMAEFIDGEWALNINNSSIPALRINSYYEDMLNDKKTKNDAKKFIKQKIENANWFISAISNRHTTILKIMSSIIKHQKTYFNSNKRELTPLTLKVIAADISMDISTISRATNGKYIQLPWGCIELKSFFSEGVLTKDNKLISNTVLKSEIKDIIENENKSNPYTDQDIMSQLKNRNYNIARRTVTKYREAMKISVARLRKEIFKENN